MIRGRTPQPTVVKKLLDTGRRRIDPAISEPSVSAAIPAMPNWLKGEAAAEWKRMGKELKDVGLIGKIDRAAFTSYCLAWAKLKKATQQLEGAGKGKGYTIVTPNGYPAMSTWLAIQNKAMDQVAKFLVEFGMSPAARARIKVVVGAEQGDLFAGWRIHRN
ncbi:MAG: phage terminase small subunit P27 family [Candidatus Marinimicrobia bacterium]|nr:phage terminase small subunit P27 family [Candidatus Neomarinimicrobiota bacterium]